MKDYIKIKKVWTDTFYFQVEITCSSDSIRAKNQIYTSEDNINDLCRKIENFVSGKVEECIWENGTRGNKSVACVSFRFIRKDKLGHILIEVYLEIDDGGTLEDHHCCFYVNTELGLLSNFSKNLPQLNEPIIGTTVILNDVD